MNPYATHLAYQVLRSLGVYETDLSQMQFTKRKYMYQNPIIWVASCENVSSGIYGQRRP